MFADPPIDPLALAHHYRAFVQPGRVLLTGHSHQAWPDVARAAVLEAFDDAAAHVDDKWTRAAAKADAVRAAIGRVTGARAADLALAPNTHELVTRFLSALDWTRRRHVVTTDGEFHSLRRQLARLEETGVEVTWVPAAPVSTLAERLAAAVRPDTAALMASTVLFRTAAVVPHLRAAVEAAHRVGAEVLLDAYHAFMTVPFHLADLGPDPIFVVAGGYKYAQWGEGCCWMRVPPDCALRPVYTGWFAEFATLADAPPGQVPYGRAGAERFAGSTYDPTSHYRAAAVAAFFEHQGLTVHRLRQQSLQQTQRLIEALPDLRLLTPEAPAERGGFVAFEVPNAGRAIEALRRRGIFVDARGDVLRLGPAPYVDDEALDAAADHVRAVVREAFSSADGLC